MNIGVPRYLIVGMAALFSAYHLVLATYSLTQQIPMHDGPIFVAMALYALGSILSLVPIGPTRMPIWIATLTVVVAIALPLLVTAELDPTKSNGYGTWYVAAVGTLMTITSTRRRHAFAWVGVGFLGYIDAVCDQMEAGLSGEDDTMIARKIGLMSTL